MNRRGTLAAGPSDDYVLLLNGKITPDEYVRRLKLDVLAHRTRYAPRRRLRNLLRFRT